jgi:hypothetical protein
MGSRGVCPDAAAVDVIRRGAARVAAALAESDAELE